MTFEQHLRRVAEAGGAINTLFEERFLAYVEALGRVAKKLATENIPYELIGGGAVLVHVYRADSSAVRMTKNIDILIHRSDLERSGLDIILPTREKNGTNPVRLFFTGERVRPAQKWPNPPLKPQRLAICDVDIAAMPVMDLVQTKLSNNRDIDRVHVNDLDQVGLITPEVEEVLPALLHARLLELRKNG